MQELKCFQHDSPHDSKNTIAENENTSNSEDQQAVATEVKKEEIDKWMEA